MARGKNRFIGIVLFMLWLQLVLTACGSSVSYLSADSCSISDAVCRFADFSSAEFTDPDNPNSAYTLMFSYGISDAAIKDCICDYSLSTVSDNDSPSFFSCIRVADGTADDVVEKIAEAMRSYADYVVSQMHLYGSAESIDDAEKYTLLTYDNGVILFVSKEDEKKDILSAIAAECGA